MHICPSSWASKSLAGRYKGWTGYAVADIPDTEGICGCVRSRPEIHGSLLFSTVYAPILSRSLLSLSMCFLRIRACSLVVCPSCSNLRLVQIFALLVSCSCPLLLHLLRAALLRFKQTTTHDHRRCHFVLLTISNLPRSSFRFLHL